MRAKSVQIGSLNLLGKQEKDREQKMKGNWSPRQKTMLLFPPSLDWNPCFLLTSISLSNKQISDSWLFGFVAFVMRLPQRTQKHWQTRSLCMAVLCVSMRMR